MMSPGYWLCLAGVFLKAGVNFAYANHISPCGITNRTGPTGEIKSPNYPYPFPNQIECEWTIESPDHAILKIDILDVDLDVENPCDENSCCSQHWLSVPYDGGRGYDRLCSKKPPTQIITVMQPLTTISYFSSESIKEGRGFSLRYTIDQVTCKALEIQCRSGGCVSNSSRCNGANDCPDGSDEEGCSVTQGVWCTNGNVPCPTTPKLCYSERFQACDGDFACPHGDDEQGCAPGCPNQIACANGEGCYDPNQRCNGIRNCRDNSDEIDCEFGCAPLQFVCMRGGCVAASVLCDGVDDCGDMSDEEHCARSFLMTAATLGVLACIVLAFVFICWLYRLYTARLRASAAVFLNELDDTEVLEDDFGYRAPPPPYAVAVAQARTPLVELATMPRVHQSRGGRHRRRRSRHYEHRSRMSPSSAPLLAQPLIKWHMTAGGQSLGVFEQQWTAAASSPSLSRSRESLTSSTSVEDLLLPCQTST